ncbi:MAG: hypothetical protein V3U30_01835 [Thermoplasmata archaeon]
MNARRSFLIYVANALGGVLGYVRILVALREFRRADVRLFLDL